MHDRHGASIHCAVRRGLNRTDESNVIVTPIPPHCLPTVSQEQGLGLAPSGATGRFSEVGPLGAQHAQVDSLTRRAHEKQPTPSSYPSYPAISTAQYPAAVPADMVQGLSTYIHRNSVAPPHSESSLQIPSLSALQDDLDSNATFSHRHASPNTPSHFKDHTPPQQGTSLAAPEALIKRWRADRRKRIGNPKDPKAAQRIKNQRRLDDENIEYLYKLLVPDSEGEVPKKDRLGLSTSQSLSLSS